MMAFTVAKISSTTMRYASTLPNRLRKPACKNDQHLARRTASNNIEDYLLKCRILTSIESHRNGWANREDQSQNCVCYYARMICFDVAAEHRLDITSDS